MDPSVKLPNDGMTSRLLFRQNHGRGVKQIASNDEALGLRVGGQSGEATKALSGKPRCMFHLG